MVYNFEDYLHEYARPVIAGVFTYAFVLGASKYWLHLDPAKGWGIMSLAAVYAGYEVFRFVRNRTK